MEDLNNIRKQLRAYVDAKIDYAAFRPWIAQAYLQLIEAGDSSALELCRAIEWECADFSEALVPEQKLRERLLELARDVVVTGQPTMIGGVFYSCKSGGASTRLRLAAAVSLPQVQMVQRSHEKVSA
jgi:hypothetical protein